MRVAPCQTPVRVASTPCSNKTVRVASTPCSNKTVCSLKPLLPTQRCGLKPLLPTQRCGLILQKVWLPTQRWGLILQRRALPTQRWGLILQRVWHGSIAGTARVYSGDSSTGQWHGSVARVIVWSRRVIVCPQIPVYLFTSSFIPGLAFSTKLGFSPMRLDLAKRIRRSCQKVE